VAYVVSNEDFSVLGGQIKSNVGFLLVVVVVQILLETGVDDVVSSGSLDREVDVFTDVRAEGEALSEREVVVDISVAVDDPWSPVEAYPGVGIELCFDLFDRSAIGEEKAASPVSFQVDRLGDLASRAQQDFSVDQRVLRGDEGVVSDVIVGRRVVHEHEQRA